MSPPPFQITPSTWWPLIIKGFPFGINQISLTIAYRFDTLLLSTHVATAAIGWYNAAYSLSRALTTFASAFSTALVPTLAREHSLNPTQIRFWYYRAFRLLLFTGLPMAVAGSLLADKIMPLLYGPDFEAASVVFAILVWDAPLLMYTSLSGNIAQASNREGSAARIFGAQAAINLVLNLLVIPRFGIIGASWTTLATELAGAIFFYRLFRREFGAGLNFHHALLLLLASGMMGVVIYLLRDLSIFITIPLGGGVYLLATWLIGALTTEEQVLIGQLINRGRMSLLRR
jgi:O-antigen/teichoic acid export membrane protein